MNSPIPTNRPDQPHNFMITEIVSAERDGDNLAVTIRDARGGTVRLNLEPGLAGALRDRLEQLLGGTDGAAEAAGDPGAI